MKRLSLSSVLLFAATSAAALITDDAGSTAEAERERVFASTTVCEMPLNTGGNNSKATADTVKLLTGVSQSEVRPDQATHSQLASTC